MVSAADIAEFETEELEHQLDETRRELFNLRFQLATGQLDNTARIRHVRKDVARILTVLRERDISEAEAIAAGDALDREPLFAPARREREEQEAEEAKAASTRRRRRTAASEETDEGEADQLEAEPDEVDTEAFAEDAQHVDEREGDA